MESNKVDARGSFRISALCYSGASLGIVALFLMLAQTVGGYPTAAVVGGTIWSFILSMMVTMPLYTGFFKRRAAKRD
jgi:hypothetical protein